MVKHNGSVTAVYIGVTADIKYQLHHLHLEDCFIQQQKENNG